jgi:hypothetical protein
MSRGNVVGMSDWLLAERSKFVSRKKQYFSPLHVVETGFGVVPASYSMGNGTFFLRSKAAVAGEGDYSPPTSSKALYTSVPNASSWPSPST